MIETIDKQKNEAIHGFLFSFTGPSSPPQQSFHRRRGTAPVLPVYF